MIGIQPEIQRSNSQEVLTLIQQFLRTRGENRKLKGLIFSGNIKAMFAQIADISAHMLQMIYLNRYIFDDTFELIYLR